MSTTSIHVYDATEVAIRELKDGLWEVLRGAINFVEPKHICYLLNTPLREQLIVLNRDGTFVLLAERHV